MADDILIFDRALRQERYTRSAANFDNHRFLIDWTNNQITERLKDIKRDFTNRLHLAHQAHFNDTLQINMDEEALPFAQNSLDLIISTLSLHSINDLPGTLAQISRCLKPDGLFLGALFGGETLHELRESLMQAELKLKDGASPRIFPFADKQQMGSLLQRAGFALPVVDSEILTVTYDNMFKLMHELRGMGESNVIRKRSRTNPGKALFFDAAEYYAQHHADPDNRIRASFEIIFLIGWSPHESQQKPLQPGSAKTRLASALNTDEITTGEKPVI